MEHTLASIKEAEDSAAQMVANATAQAKRTLSELQTSQAVARKEGLAAIESSAVSAKKDAADFAQSHYSTLLKKAQADAEKVGGSAVKNLAAAVKVIVDAYDSQVR